MAGITEISKIVNYSYRYKVRYISVSDSLFSQFDQLFKKFFKELGPAVETRIYAKLVYHLKKTRYQLSTNLLPYNQIVSQELLFTIEDMIKQVKSLNPESEELFEKILEVLNYLNNHKSNALFECLKQNILRYSSYSYCIVTKKDIYTTEKDYILAKFKSFNINFMGEKKFREEKKNFDYVIFIGNESYFHHSFNNTPKSRITSYLSRDVYQNKFFDNSLFLEWPFPVFSTMYRDVDFENANFKYNLQETEASIEKEEAPKTDYIEELQEQEEHIQEPSFSLPFIKFINETINSIHLDIGLDDFENERVPAKAFELYDEKFIFIRISKGHHDVITEDSVFVRKRVNEIVTGDSLILSSISDERLVERMADVMFELQNIKLYRQRQAKLKNLLLRNTEKFGIEGFCDLLKRKGLNTINEHKVKNLLKPTSFKLQNKKEYFNFLLILSKNDQEKALKYFESGRKLAVFHISAGKKVRQMLREALKNLDLTELLAHGAQLIELKEAEGLSLEIRKVEAVGEELIQIHPYQNKKIIDF